MRRTMTARRALLACAAFASIALTALQPAMAQEEQTLVDRATLTVQEMLSQSDANAARDAQSLLGDARAVIVCPRVFRAGFLFGGQGGDCVLTARDGAGSWSSPAFYTIGSASFGLQIGVQDMSVMMMILTEKGLSAVLDSQFKFGADASIAVATLGAGIAGATTAAVGADIVSFARTRGLYAGISLEGSLLSSRNDFNTNYYGRSVAARQIVLDMQAHNPASDPLRGILMRYSSRQAPAPMAAAPGPMQGGMPSMQTAPVGGITRETLR